MEHKDFIENKKYHAYVKGGLALRYLQDGLCDFVKEISERQHEAIKKAVGLTPENTCNNCNIKTLKPHSPKEGSKPGKFICPKNKKNCTCVRKEYKECPNKICDVFMEAVIESEETGEPNWKNPHILSQWQNSSWELQKCFIKSPGYDKTKSADETDAVGLLILLAHNIFFKNYMEVIPDKKITDWRCTLFHSASMELEYQQLTSGIEDIKTVLQDEKCLKNMECSKRALRNIEKLQTENFYISNEDKIKVCMDALAFIKQKLEYYNIQIYDQKRDQEITEEKTDTLATDLSKFSVRLDTHEEQIKSLDQRVSILEKEREEWRKGETIQKAHLKTLEGRKELRRSLAAFFGKNYVTTSACPLKPNKNVIEISDVYVEPYLKIKQEENQNQTNNSITSYNELFERNKTRLKRIYILGDVGSGKSAFCQMLMHDWMKSVNELNDINESQTNVDEKIPADKTSLYNDIKEMLKFDYLFYIPLRRLSGHSDICKMIQLYYNREVPSEKVLNDVLLNSPEKCLIIADGIDEWSPGQRDIQPEHETYGLPSAGDIKQATILMTSRPSSPGILAMNSSESDQTILLQGIRNTKELVINLYAKLKKIKGKKDHATIGTILSRLKTVQIRDLYKSPLLLKYIVWLLCFGSEVGVSVCEVYCSILNILLRWTERKSTQNQSTGYYTDIHMTDFNENMKHLRLPRLVKKYPSCKSNSMLIFTLGKIAFELLIQRKCSEMAFGRHTLMQKGISGELIQILLQTGLLTEEIRFDPTDEPTQFSFINIAFLEYFAALFIASHPDVQTDVLTNKTKSNHFKNVLEYLFRTVSSAADIFQLENVLVLTCGISAALIIANHLGVQKDVLCHQTKSSHFKDVLKHLFTTFSSAIDIVQLQNVLVLACGLAPHILHEVCECIYNKTFFKATNDLENWYVSKYVKNSNAFPNIPVLSPLHGETKLMDVQELILNCLSEWRANNKCLDIQVPLTASIIISDCHLSNILYFNPLKVLHLFIWIGKPHDMSYIKAFNNLQTLSLRFASLPHDTLTLLCTHVSRTSSLSIINFEYLMCLDHKRECQNNVIDLSHHSNLQHIHCKDTKMLIFENINTLSLEHCSTDRTHLLRQVMSCRNLRSLTLEGLDLDVADFSKLVTFINTETSLTSLHLFDVNCKDSFECCKIDMSGHHHLQTLKVICSHDFCFASIAETKLDICVTDSYDMATLLKNSEILKMSTSLFLGMFKDGSMTQSRHGELYTFQRFPDVSGDK